MYKRQLKGRMVLVAVSNHSKESYGSSILTFCVLPLAMLTRWKPRRVDVYKRQLFADPVNGDLTIKDTSSPIVSSRAGDTRWLP